MDIFINILVILGISLIASLLPMVYIFLIVLVTENIEDKIHNKNRTFKEKCQAINELFSIEVRRK